MRHLNYTKPNYICYRFAQIVSWFVAKILFRRRIIRNELKGVKGPFVVIANHQAALDFVNLIGLSCRRMTFVISNSFYQTLPIKGLLNKMGVIPKQQFQTTIRDMKRMKRVVDNGHPLVIYPAGLMCEDGLSTPIPAATYKFLKWLGVDVYMARVQGTYFVMPKWAKGIRPGRTNIDVYKLLDKDELAMMDVPEIRARAEEALLFDAYREQEDMRVRYSKGNNIKGLEFVLYKCPHCGEEHTIEVRGDSILTCTACGYALECDEYAFLHNRKGLGPDLRYVSDWSKITIQNLRDRVLSGGEQGITAVTDIYLIDPRKNKFHKVGSGTITLTKEKVCLSGQVKAEDIELSVPVTQLPSIPFGPGKYLELQQGDMIYRCILADGRLVMKFIHLLKIFHEVSCQGEAVLV